MIDLLIYLMIQLHGLNTTETHQPFKQRYHLTINVQNFKEAYFTYHSA